MFKTITKELSKNEVIDLLRGMDAQEVEDNFSVRRVLIDTQACDVFGGDPEDSYPLIPGTYIAFYYYKSLAGDPYSFFEKVCANLIEDEEKCQTLMNEDGCIKIAARQWHNNNTNGYRDFRSKEAISKSFSEIAVLCMS